MAVILVEVPDDQVDEMMDELIEKFEDINEHSFKNTHNKDLKEYEWWQKYDAMMGAG